MPVDDDVNVRNVIDYLRQRAAELDGAATIAVLRVDKREGLAQKHIAHVHRARVLEHHEGVTVGVAAAKVVQIDLVTPTK